MDQLSAIPLRAMCHIRVWPDPDHTSVETTLVWTAETAVAVCGPKTVKVLREAAHSLPSARRPALVYEAIKTAMGRNLVSAGFCYVDEGDGDMVVMGLPGEPRVSVSSAYFHRTFSNALLAAEVLCS